MKRIIRFMLAFVVIICLASCDNKTPEANLKNDIDSLSYSSGVAHAQGLKEYLVERMGIDTAYIDQFIKGLNEGANAGDNKQHAAYYAGIQIGQQISNQVVKGINQEVFGNDSTKTISLKNFLAGFISEIKGNNNLMTMQRAIEISQRLMSVIKNKENLERNQIGDNEQQLTDNLTENESEAEERAPREAAEQAERESKTWTGASSESELRQKLDGTSWYINWKGLKHKFVFSDGAITLYTSLDGDFNNEGKYYDSYLVKSKGEYLVVGFGDEEKYLDNYQIVFIDSRAILGMHGKPIGDLTFMGR